MEGADKFGTRVFELIIGLLLVRMEVSCIVNEGFRYWDLYSNHLDGRRARKLEESKYKNLSVPLSSE